MRKTQVKIVISDIKQKYHILGRDIAAAIGLSANHLSNLCSGRYPLTDVYRDMLADKFPDCAEQILALPVTVRTPPELEASSKPLYTAFRKELESMVSLAREYTSSNDARLTEINKNQHSLIEQNKLLVEQHAGLLKIQEDLIKMGAEDSEIIRQMQSNQDRLISSVVETMNTQNEIMRRLADRLLGDTPQQA